uniref:Ubiquitin-like domain-containing protein n=1 Tax=Glossina palpalis gambiensis TaxID=67801 RepID=A0A1B0BGT7_9MUSC
MDKPSDLPNAVATTSALSFSTSVNSVSNSIKTDDDATANQIVPLNEGNCRDSGSIHATNDTDTSRHSVRQNLGNSGCAPSTNAFPAAALVKCNNTNDVNTSPSYSANARANARNDVSISSTNSVAPNTSSTVPGKNGLVSVALLSSIPHHRNQSTQLSLFNLSINTTIGKEFTVTVDPFITVECLKQIISKKLKLVQDRICLLHHEKQLRHGTLHENNLTEDSKVILIPNVETGLSPQRGENAVLQALVSLSDAQINNFIDGKAPLNLNIHLGGYTMVIQLHMSCSVTRVVRRRINCGTLRPRSDRRSAKCLRCVNANGLTANANLSTLSPCVASNAALSAATTTRSSSLLHKRPNKRKCRHYQHHRNRHRYHHHRYERNDTALPREMIDKNSTSLKGNDAAISSKFIGSRLTSSCGSSLTSANTNCTALLPSSDICRISGFLDREDSDTIAVINSFDSIKNNPTLAEASWNLTQIVRKLSNEMFTKKTYHPESEEELSKEETVVESMKSQSKCVYSRTFSGTLYPALQDKYGRPKNGISTIVHILNNLLNGGFQDRRETAITFDGPSTSTAAANSVTPANGSIGRVCHSSRNGKQLSKYHRARFCVKCLKAYSFAAPITDNASVPIQTAISSLKTSSNDRCNECNATDIMSNKSYAMLDNGFDVQPSTSSAASGSSLGVAASASSSDRIANAFNSHYTHRHNHHHVSRHPAKGDGRKVCQCRVLNQYGEHDRENTCLKCTIDLQNRKTKSKIDQLRLVMLESKQNREARKLKIVPHGEQDVSTTATSIVTAANLAALAIATNSATSSSIATNEAIAGATTDTSSNQVSVNQIVKKADTIT